MWVLNFPCQSKTGIFANRTAPCGINNGSTAIECPGTKMVPEEPRGTFEDSVKNAYDLFRLSMEERLSGLLLNHSLIEARDIADGSIYPLVTM